MQEIMKFEKQLIEISNEQFLNIYYDSKPSKNSIEKQYGRLENAFGSKLPEGFFVELSDTIARNRITENELKDNITHLIESNEFPSIAKIINPHKKIRLITRDRFLMETKDQSSDFRSRFLAIEVEGQLFYAQKSELERYKVPYKLWNKPVTTPRNFRDSKQRDFTPLNKSFNMNEYFQKIIEEMETNPKTSDDYAELKMQIKLAGKFWGKDPDKYSAAKNRAIELETKLGIRY